MQEATITAMAAEMNDGFGGSLAVEGNMLVVGSSGKDGEAGSAHVFQHTEDGWMHQAALTGEDAGPDDAFGGTVGLSGGAVFVGAPAADSSAGAAYVFEQDEDGMWMQVARLQGSEVKKGGRFGTAIAAAEDMRSSEPTAGTTRRAAYICSSKTLPQGNGPNRNC